MRDQSGCFHGASGQIIPFGPPFLAPNVSSSARPHEGRPVSLGRVDPSTATRAGPGRRRRVPRTSHRPCMKQAKPPQLLMTAVGGCWYRHRARKLCFHIMWHVAKLSCVRMRRASHCVHRRTVRCQTPLFLLLLGLLHTATCGGNRSQDISSLEVQRLYFFRLK